ncbi:MAG: hypothetical protein KAJ21_03460 [Thermoplasmatales archaeon]|nr:hypothetical protein [Thermoplasmatales archaeon]
MEINSLLVFQDNMYFFFLAYFLLGGGIKYIDAAFDDKVFKKRNAIIIAPFLGILWSYTMLINEISASILLAVLIAVLIKGKIDNMAHLIGLITIIIFGIFIILFIDGNGFMLLPLIFLTSAGIIDEVGNDIIDYNKSQKKVRFRYNFLIYFFGRRYLMKTAIIYIALIGLFPLYFVLAFIFFDESYIIMDLFSKSRQKIDGT